MNRKKLLIILAIVFQIGVVATMAVSREWLLATGKPYLFQTAPIDPRDIFRGDYVRLSYLFNRVPAERIELDEVIRREGLRKGQKVYLSLQTDGNGISSGGKLYTSPPQGAYLQGYVTYHWPYYSFYRLNDKERKKSLANASAVQVKYGIEQYYVQQNKGKEMEAIRGKRNDFQVPMLIHTAVSDSGVAAIRSYEWSNIAVKTEVLRAPRTEVRSLNDIEIRDLPASEQSAVIKLTLKNRGDTAITLPLKADNCSFGLIAAGDNTPKDATDFIGVRDCEKQPVQKVVLQPEQSHEITFDLNQPYLRIMYENKPTTLGALPWNYRYRIQYQGEPIEGVKAMIVSSGFRGRGNID